MATSFGAAAARSNLLAERARLLEELGEPIEAPGQMTYGSQAAAASHVFEQQRDLALRERSRGELEKVEAALRFVRSGGSLSIITALDQLAPAIDGHVGTVIENPERER